ncbi:MAG: hydroxyacid dehydrogenase [Rhodobacteraceae bacterium]|nr:hydroxyacid dehydrogenase [Paracoccaceae bacterium]
MKKVTVIGQLHQSGLDILYGHGGLEITEFTDPKVPVSKASITGADALLVRTGNLTTEDIRDAVNLRVVSRHGVGCDNLPVDALSARGIPVTIVGPVNAISVAEQTLTMMLTLTKRVAEYDRAVRSGDWEFRNSLRSNELAGKTLLLLGLGRIGSEVAKRAAAFDMNILAYDPYQSAEVIRSAGATRIEVWFGALGSADILSIHLPLSDATRNIIDAKALAAMKPGAIILNAARGGLIDEAALFHELGGRMASGGAGLDVFEVEPPPLNTPLLTLPNVVVSPHSAAMTEQSARKMAEVSAHNVIAGLEGGLDPALIFNRKALADRGQHET